MSLNKSIRYLTDCLLCVNVCLLYTSYVVYKLYTFLLLSDTEISMYLVLLKCIQYVHIYLRSPADMLLGVAASSYIQLRQNPTRPSWNRQIKRYSTSGRRIVEMIRGRKCCASRGRR